MNSKLKFIIPVLIALVVLCGAAYELGSKAHKAPAAANSSKSSSTSSNTTPSTTTAKQATAPEPSFHVGDTQTDGNVEITLDSTDTGTTMQQIPDDETIFVVNITVANSGSTPFESKDAFVGVSSVYTQVGNDTSTGKYSKAYATPCFGGGDVVIQPGDSTKGCVQFMVPKNALVDTYLYDGLKWYL